MALSRGGAPTCRVGDGVDRCLITRTTRGTRSAARGAPRGADAVLTAAVTAAESGRDGVPVAEMSERRPRPGRRPRGRRTFGIVGIAALLGVGGYAIAGVQSTGTGADSPQAAVQQLANTIDHQDALAAVATLDPSEISTLQSSVSSAEHKAKQAKLVKSSGSPFAGINLSVDGLHTSVTTLADGVAKVTLSGSISASVEAGKLSEALQRVAGNAQGSVDLAQLGVHGGAPFVITVERDGKWYVSPAYTAFEYIRTNQDLPEADFGSADASKLGADTAPDAVVQLVRAIGAGDWNTVASLVPPDQFPLYEYRAAFTQLMNKTFGAGQLFTVNAIDAKAHLDGTKATVDLTAGGTFPETTRARAHPKLRGGNSSTVHQRRRLHGQLEHEHCRDGCRRGRDVHLEPLSARQWPTSDRLEGRDRRSDPRWRGRRGRTVVRESGRHGAGLPRPLDRTLRQQRSRVTRARPVARARDRLSRRSIDGSRSRTHRATCSRSPSTRTTHSTSMHQPTSSSTRVMTSGRSPARTYHYPATCTARTSTGQMASSSYPIPHTPATTSRRARTTSPPRDRRTRRSPSGAPPTHPRTCRRASPAAGRPRTAARNARAAQATEREPRPTPRRVRRSRCRHSHRVTVRSRRHARPSPCRDGRAFAGRRRWVRRRRRAAARELVVVLGA